MLSLGSFCLKRQVSHRDLQTLPGRSTHRDWGGEIRERNSFVLFVPGRLCRTQNHAMNAVRASKLISRSRRIDRFFTGLVHEIAGPVQSGKSYLCYNEIISYLHEYPGFGVVIDVCSVELG